MKDKKFILISSLIILFTVSLSFYGFRFIENSAHSNMKDSDKEPIYFGATYMTMNNPFFDVINEQIKSVVEANGDVLITLDPALSADKQMDHMRYLIDQGVKVIFVNPIDSERFHDILLECKEKNIFIIEVDTSLKASDYVSYSVISDNYQAGVDAANEMMRNIKTAKIVLLEHAATDSGTKRIQGFVDTIANNANYQIVARKECEGQLEIATPVMNSIIESGIDFDVVMALNDPSAMGAMAAMQEADIKDVYVYGVDGTPEIKRLIAEGRNIVSVAQSPIQMGKKAVEVAYKLLDGKTFKNNTYLIPVTLITKANINEFSLDGWQ